MIGKLVHLTEWYWFGMFYRFTIRSFINSSISQTSRVNSSSTSGAQHQILADFDIKWGKTNENDFWKKAYWWILPGVAFCQNIHHCLVRIDKNASQILPHRRSFSRVPEFSPENPVRVYVSGKINQISYNCSVLWWFILFLSHFSLWYCETYDLKSPG